MADAESISLEETNKIRLSLGLQPLEAPPPSNSTANSITVDDEERIAFENLQSLRAEQAKKAEEEALRLRLKKARDRKALNEKLVGRTLADPEGEEEDLKSWIKKTKRREKELAEQRARELESQDKLFQEEYTERDLEGLKVGHDFGDIEEGEGMILTIKDKGVLDEDDGDELISTSLAEKERLKENLDNKIRKPKYDPYAEEYEEDTGEKKILSKYDEDIDGGPKKKAFVLGKSQDAATTQRKRNQMDPSSNLTAISLEYDRPMEIASDYMDPSTIKIKKPKKKKAKNTKISALVDDEGLLPVADPEAMAQEAAPSIATTSVKRTHDEDSGFGDDEELQEMLAQRRRQQQKKRKYTRPEDIMRNIRQEMDEDDSPAQEGGLVIDDTSEFVRGIEMTQQDDSETRSQRKSETAMDIDPDATILHENGDTEMADEQLPEPVNETPLAVLDDEPIVGSSVAATLAALKRKGDLTDHNPSSNFSITDLQKREEILSRQRQRQIESELEARKQREAERANERWNRMSQREREQYREQQNQRREKEEARRKMEEFNEIKFNVELEYRDEFGHQMTPKDAFKKLSHTFHGKGSGTMKRGKYLQKVQEKSKTQVSGSAVGDLEKTNSLRERQKAQGTAYTRIQ